MGALTCGLLSQSTFPVEAQQARSSQGHLSEDIAGVASGTVAQLTELSLEVALWMLMGATRYGKGAEAESFSYPADVIN